MHAPRSIVSLISNGTEILLALGLADRVLAVSHECDYPADAARKPRATRSHIDSSNASLKIDEQVRELFRQGLPLYELDAELLAKLAPELIVTQAQCDVCAIRYDDVMNLVQTRRELSQTQVLALNPHSLAEVLADVLRVGEAAGVLETAREYAAHLQARIERVRMVASSISPENRPRVACIEWIEPLMLAANWTPELVELAGGESGLAQSGRHSVYNEWRQVLAYDPEVLLIMPCGFDLPRTLVEAAALPNWPNWQDLSAVRQGRVVAVDGNAYFNRSGPRLVESLEIMAYLLHPALFPPPLAETDRSSAWSNL